MKWLNEKAESAQRSKTGARSKKQEETGGRTLPQAPPLVHSSFSLFTISRGLVKWLNEKAENAQRSKTGARSKKQEETGGRTLPQAPLLVHSSFSLFTISHPLLTIQKGTASSLLKISPHRLI